MSNIPYNYYLCIPNILNDVATICVTTDEIVKHIEKGVVNLKLIKNKCIQNDEYKTEYRNFICTFYKKINDISNCARFKTDNAKIFNSDEYDVNILNKKISIPALSKVFFLQKKSNHGFLFFSCDPNTLSFKEIIKKQIFECKHIQQYPILYFDYKDSQTSNYDYLIKQNSTYNDILDKRSLRFEKYIDCKKSTIQSISKLKFTFNSDDLLFENYSPKNIGIYNFVYSLPEKVDNCEEIEFAIIIITRLLHDFAEFNKKIHTYFDEIKCLCEKDDV